MAQEISSLRSPSRLYKVHSLSILLSLLPLKFSFASRAIVFVADHTLRLYSKSPSAGRSRAAGIIAVPASFAAPLHVVCSRRAR